MHYLKEIHPVFLVLIALIIVIIIRSLIQQHRQAQILETTFKNPLSPKELPFNRHFKCWEMVKQGNKKALKIKVEGDFYRWYVRSEILTFVEADTRYNYQIKFEDCRLLLQRERVNNDHRHIVDIYYDDGTVKIGH